MTTAAPSAAIIARHCGYASMAGCRPRTVSLKGRILQAFDRRAPLLTATRADVIEWIDRGLSPQTRSNYLAHLRSFYSWARDEELRLDDPTTRIPTPKIPRRLPRPMADADLSRALAGAPEPIRTWLTLAAFGGLRGCEIALVDGEHIDWLGRRLIIPEGKGGGSGWVPLHPEIAASLDLWPRQAGPLWPDGYHSITARSNRYLHSIGIDSTLHTVRHWFGTNVLRASGGNVRVAQECLRHASIASTAIYTEVSSAERSAAVDLLRVG